MQLWSASDAGYGCGWHRVRCAAWLQVGLEKRLSHGFQVQSNFTWSRTTDVGGSGDPELESSVSDPLDIHHDYGLSSLNYPLISVTNFIYEAPKFEGHNLLIKNTLGGWEVSGLFTAQSGSPFTMNGGQGNNNSGFLVGQDRADVVAGQTRAFVRVARRTGSITTSTLMLSCRTRQVHLAIPRSSPIVCHRFARWISV